MEIEGSSLGLKRPKRKAEHLPPTSTRLRLRGCIYLLPGISSWLSAWLVKYLLKLVSWPSLWSSGQSSWLQIQRPGFDSPRYDIFWELVGLERGALSLVSTSEELLGRKNSGYGLESREYGRKDTSRWPRGTFYPQKLALTSPSGAHSVGIVRSRTQAMEFSFSVLAILWPLGLEGFISYLQHNLLYFLSPLRTWKFSGNWTQLLNLTWESASIESSRFSCCN
jgi:hypothetical protein